MTTALDARCGCRLDTDGVAVNRCPEHRYLTLTALKIEVFKFAAYNAVFRSAKAPGKGWSAFDYVRKWQERKNK